MNTIQMRCSECARSMQVERASYDPPEAATMSLNGCDLCEANQGGWEETHYYRSDGTEVLQQ